MIMAEAFLQDDETILAITGGVNVLHPAHSSIVLRMLFLLVAPQSEMSTVQVIDELIA